MGAFFLKFYLLLGTFGAKLLFTGGDFFVDNWALFTLMGRDGRWVGLPEEVDDRMEGALLTAPLRPGTSRNFEDGSMVKDRRHGTRWKHKSKG